MISSVYIFTNGMVVVFDEQGQVPRLQGRFATVAEQISAELNDGTEIFMAQWHGERLPITREAFDRLWKKENAGETALVR